MSLDLTMSHCETLLAGVVQMILESFAQPPILPNIQFQNLLMVRRVLQRPEHILGEFICFILTT